MRRWYAVDWLVAGYATFVAGLAVVCAIPQAPLLVAAHATLVAGMWWLPPRGASWESPRPGDSRGRARLRVIARFLRYTYPALLLTPFFEEVTLTVNAVAPEQPYWFEPYLIAADRALFGGTPAAMLSQGGNVVLDEIMHGFYLSYYFLITAGIVRAWRGPVRGRPTPGAGFHTAFTGMMLGFILSFVCYPFLPARGPWEHAALVGGLRPFEGWVFTPAIEMIIAGAAVSGGCLPSAHVSGTWALTFGLFPHHRRAARWWAVMALGLSVACVYTRYHHVLDVVAGVTVAAIAAFAASRLRRAS
ncbi:MAG TPA: phosphatase PAP2 family protein [Vicinamibacterales bacterium]|nr:phosphatase PAP2 family protein [Vicinamibacterales bacterium]